MGVAKAMLVAAAVVYLGGIMMKSKLCAALTAAGCALILGIGAAKAVTITTFDVLATFDSTCPGCSLGGSFQIDTGTTSDVQPLTVNITMTPAIQWVSRASAESGAPGVSPSTFQILPMIVWSSLIAVLQWAPCAGLCAVLAPYCEHICTTMRVKILWIR